MTEKGVDPRFATARALLELGELTAQWLEGRFEAIPTWRGRPDAETSELIPALAMLNRAGYVTEFSQPGDVAEEQRAAVAGFCDERTADHLWRALASTELVVLSYPPGVDEPSLHVPVTLDAGVIRTCVRGSADPDVMSPGCWSANALVALRSAWQVSVFDPVWGRNDLLWPRLAECIVTPRG